MSTSTDLLKEITAFCREAGISEWAFSKTVVNDGKFTARLREGSGVRSTTLDKVRAYIAKERAKAARKAGKAA